MILGPRNRPPGLNAPANLLASSPATTALLRRVSSLRRRVNRDRLMKTIEQSGLFDRKFYLSESPDVVAAGLDPLEHFVNHGAAEGRNPSLHFSTKYYLDTYLDVAQSGVNPLYHYIKFGRAEGRLPTSLDYQGSLLRRSGLFDDEYYLTRYDDVRAAGMDPAHHYLLSGWREGRDPCERFSTRAYIRENPQTGQMNPLLHYIATGAAAGRPADALTNQAGLVVESGLFDADFYLTHNPDVKDAGVDPALHYVTSGWWEGRDPSARFSTTYYLTNNPEVAALGLNPLVHWMMVGRKEGIEPPPPLSTRRRWTHPGGGVWEALFNEGLAGRLERVKAMDLSKPLGGDGPTFSFITTVYDTSPVYLRALTETVIDQAFEDFEWVLLDNGSRDPETIAECIKIGNSDPRIIYLRVDNNLHIIGGNRFAFERAKGHYVIPIDSDDLLYPDSLALFANVISDNAADLPTIIFSDEHRVDENGDAIDLIWRWDMSMSHAIVTAPAAHLMALRRDVASEVGVYTEDYAKGAHDWDSALRILERPGRTVHVPEVLYAWRAHMASTAGDLDSKSYIVDSQSAVTREALRRRGLDDRISTVPLFGSVGWNRLVRSKDVAVPPIEIFYVFNTNVDMLPVLENNIKHTAEFPAGRRLLVCGEVSDELAAVAKDAKMPLIACASRDEVAAHWRAAEDETFAHVVVGSAGSVQSSEGLWDAVGFLEVDRRAGIIGGPILGPDGGVLSLGLVAGLDDFIGGAFRSWSFNDLPQHLYSVTRPTSAVPAIFLAIRGSLIRQGVAPAGVDDGDALFGIELSARAAAAGFQTIYVDHMSVIVRRQMPMRVGAGSRMKSTLLRDHAAFFRGDNLSPYLSRRSEAFAQLKTAEEIKPAFGDDRRFSPWVPLNLVVEPSLAKRPRLNVLIPAIRMASMSGGPNTALNFAYRLAKAGFPVRLMSTDASPDLDSTETWKHIMSISGIDKRLMNIDIVDVSNRKRENYIGRNDIFMATAWWTAQMAQEAASLVGEKPFVYFIQDFEPILYANSSLRALTEETYGFNYIPIINSHLLRDYFVTAGIGSFRDPEFAKSALSFQPAIPRASFHPVEGRAAKSPYDKRRLLFYARPTTGERNLFDLGVAALRQLAGTGDISDAYWDVVGMGEKFDPMDLGPETTLQCAPWLSFDDYATLMRESDILLSLMLSPHPSYPPLEMAACGGLVVTCTYENKTADALKSISPNIIAAPPTVRGIAQALREAINRLDLGTATPPRDPIELPDTWDESFGAVIDALAGHLTKLGHKQNPKGAFEVLELDLPTGGDNPLYTEYLRAAARSRKMMYAEAPEPGLLSFVSTVWNTPPAFLDVLARSIADQHGGTGFEWFILDNGSNRQDVIEYLARLAANNPYIRLERVEKNLGIIGGMRYCLERASGRYILPLDSDDYLDPDCVKTITWALQKHNYPDILYTDEDKLRGVIRSGPYLKPDWDPVLFVNSCYIAHLCAIDRVKALALDAFSDPACEGSHDWDTFTRFVVNGSVPHHVPEVLYSWRMHEQSTASNINSKPVVFDSQKAVLERFLAGHPLGANFKLAKSPLFGATPDWWLQRRRDLPAPGVTTVVIRMPQDAHATPATTVPKGADHTVEEVQGAGPLSALLAIARSCREAGRLVHLQAAGTDPMDGEWFYEAIGLMEMFPDTVMVGGRTQSHGKILTAGYVFGFGWGCECPDKGRPVEDPGYAAQMWKQRSVNAVSAQHAVVSAKFLVAALERLRGQGASYTMLGAWLGLEARLQGRRVAYTPFFNANTTIDWEQLVPAAEQGLWLSQAAPFIPEQSLVSPDLGLTSATAYLPKRAAAPTAVRWDLLPGYHDWARAHEAATPAPTPLGDITFSVLTGVYSGTDTELFKVTASTVQAQVYEKYEWIVLAHGPIPPELAAYLKTLRVNKKVAIKYLDENLGIIGGMRYLLEQARGEYIVSLDGDDCLTPGTLAELARVLGAGAVRPAIAYTDEDIVIGDRLQSPYVRPDWDPVLDLENSWIWHAVAFRRDIALKIGVYASAGSEYCHDWDTIYRFSRDGHEPVHVRSSQYHWRHHVRSTSAAPGGNHGSSRSVRALLEEKIRDRGLEDRVQISPFPISRGAEEWWIERKPIELPPAETATLWPEERAWRDLLGRVAGRVGPNGLVLLRGAGVIACDEPAVLREATKLFEFHDEVCIASGRLRQHGVVVTAGWMTTEEGLLTAPYDELLVGDPGPFVLGWKPQSISVGVLDLCCVRGPFLLEALASVPADCSLFEFGIYMGALAAAKDLRVAFTPIIQADVKRQPLHPMSRAQVQTAWTSFTSRLGARTSVRRGAAGYHVRRHG